MSGLSDRDLERLGDVGVATGLPRPFPSRGCSRVPGRLDEPGGERGPGQHSERGVRSVVVVVDPPVLDQDLRLGQAGERFDGQQLVPDPGPKLSTYGFCHGEPGSMYALPA